MDLSEKNVPSITNKMDTLIFATNNPNKVSEVKSILKNRLTILSLAEAGIHIDIPEPFDTLEENAYEKARVIHVTTGSNCFAEDTGLEVDSLNGEPGVKSARYAGEEKSPDDNIEKLLANLKDKKNRNAQFKTVISIIIDNKQHIFDGICKGTIVEERRGESGFGYDPVFVPDDADKTFAEMTIEEKSIFSHRKKAFEKLMTFLTQQ
jgi:XTP/dITP diphosphohydrolase